MFRDELRRLEVSLDARVLHELHVAEIREALAANRVARCIDADFDVDAREVADGVRVLGAGEPTNRDSTRIACVRCPRRPLATRRIHAAAVARSSSDGNTRSFVSGGILPAPSMSATRSQSCQLAPTDIRDDWPIKRSILRSAVRSCVPWHSKQYSLKISGAAVPWVRAHAVRVAGPAAGVAGRSPGTGDLGRHQRCQRDQQTRANDQAFHRVPGSRAA